MTETVLMALERGEVAALESALATVSKHNGETATEARVLAGRCEQFAQSQMAATWRELANLLKAGTIRDVNQVGRDVLNLFRRRLAVMQSVQQLGGASRYEVIEAVAAFIEQIEAEWPWDFTEQLPSNRQMIEESRASLARGEGQSIDDLLSQAS